jgi:hypothetical protein
MYSTDLETHHGTRSLVPFRFSKQGLLRYLGREKQTFHASLFEQRTTRYSCQPLLTDYDRWVHGSLTDRMVALARERGSLRSKLRRLFAGE